MYPVPLAPGAELRIPVDEPSVVRSSWRRAMPRRRRLAVLDTHFPWRLSGFRYLEGLQLLEQQPSTEFFSLWPLTDPFPKPVRPLWTFPEVADELGITDAYWVFLHTTVGLLGMTQDGASDVLVHEGSYSLRRTFDALGIRRHVMLWPGGGMVARTPQSVVEAVGRAVDTVFTNVAEVEQVVPRSVYIPMAVDTGFYTWQSRDFTRGQLRMVFAGADSDRKGLATLLAAFAQLDPGRFHLTVIGPHDRHAAAMAGPNIEVVGWSPPERLREIYLDSHVFVSPAGVETQNPDELGMVDGFPTTTASDAMATGCALVSSNPRQEHRALTPGSHYIEFPIGDVEALTATLRHLEQDRHHLAALADAGARRVATFSIERVVQAKLRTMGIGPNGRPIRRGVHVKVADDPCAPKEAPPMLDRFRIAARSQARTKLQRIAGVAMHPVVAGQQARDQALGTQLDDLRRSLVDRESQVVRDHSIEHRLEVLQRSVDDLGAEVARVRAIASSALDEIPAMRRQLAAIRESEEYTLAYEDPEPLVTVRIATYNLAEILVERALASVRAQTYERLEIIVVGDACTDDTEQRVGALGDPRVRFINLPYQGPYPEPPSRWLVAGSPGMNVGAAMARGRWIAPLDDDDEFVPDHVEVLLAHARRTRAEVAYGNILQRSATPDDADVVLSSHPPELGQFGFQAALYHSMLRCFAYNTKSWLLDEPGDWNLARRMLEAGVTFGWLDRVVSVYYPSTLHAPRRG